MTPRDPSPRVRHWLGRLVVGLALAVSLLALRADSLRVPLTHWRLGRGDVLLGVGLIWGLAWAGRHSPPRVTLAIASLLITLMVLVPWAITPPGRGQVTLESAGTRVDRALGLAPAEVKKIWVSEYEWYEPHEQLNARYGYTMMPDCTARHHHRDFDVVYHCDHQGWRRMPAPVTTAAGPEIAFVGCSFTFGYGVEDDEPFPALLAAKAWPDYRVGNYSAIGWGTSQAMLVIEDLLNRETPPAAICYGYITDHLRRNYRRKSYYGLIGRPFPCFEPVDSGVSYAGLLPATDADWSDGPELDAREVEVTERLVARMGEQCRARGTSFFLLILQLTNDPWAGRLKSAPPVDVIDLSQVGTAKFAHDWHPTAVWHRQIARALCRLPVLAETTGGSALYQPDRLAPVAECWDLQLNWGKGAGARPRRVESSPAVFELEDIHGLPDHGGGVSIRRSLPRLDDGKVKFSAEVRADKAAKIVCYVAPVSEPDRVIGRAVELAVSTDWQRIEWEFDGPCTAPRPTWTIHGLSQFQRFSIRHSQALQDGVDLFQIDPTVEVSLGGN